MEREEAQVDLQVHPVRVRPQLSVDPRADGTYCEKPSKYRMVEDGGEPGAEKVRQYDPFCPEHTEASARQELVEDLDDELI